MKRLLTSIIASLTLTAGFSQAQETAPKSLAIGDKAPSIKEVTWIKGQPVTSFKEGEAYILECWATWCGPCIRGIPHLTKLQKQYKGKLRVLGVAIWERGSDPMPKVRQFVEGQGDKMDYTVGLESNDSIAKNWMGPAGQTGIPCSFLIGKDGYVEWIGHPAAIDPVLEKYFAGKWDREAEAAEFRRQQETERVMMTLQDQLMNAYSTGDFDGAIKTLDEVIAKHPDMPELVDMKFQFMLLSKDHAQDAYTVGEEILRRNQDNAMQLNAISWNILSNPRIQYRNLDFALRAAQRANTLTEGKDASVLDTLARAWFEKKDYAKAIEIQEKAIAVSEDGPMKDDLMKTLEEYRQAQPQTG